MRTTVTLSDEVAAAVGRLRRDRGVGVSEAVNELARRGLRESEEAEPFIQETSAMGARTALDNIADLLEAIDGPATR